MAIEIATIERFESYVIPEPNSGCHLWMGATVPDGYGSFYWPFDGRYSLKAHRAAWIIYVGPLQDEIQVLHHCDNPPCVNVDHLFCGTNADNVADRCAKGRSACLKGSENPRAKLTEDDASLIFADPRPYAEIAADFGISRGPVGAIKRGLIWRHITGGAVSMRGVLRGDDCPWSKLSSNDVRSIRCDARSRKRIAEDYGVTSSLIDRIIWRKAWAHVD
jgi:hypothetical protein